jgi:hypothetical protein
MYSEDQSRGIAERGQENVDATATQAIGPSGVAPGAEPEGELHRTSDEDDFWSSFTVPNHRAAIFAAYNGGLGPIMETATACLEAETQLDPAQKQALLKDLPFRPPSFSKYVRIGQDGRLHDPNIRNKLPPKFTVLYLLSQLSQDDFAAVVQDGILRCGLRRSELEQWIKVRREPKIGKPKVSKLPRAFAAALKPLSVLSLDKELEEEFRNRLKMLGAEFSMEVVFPTDKYMTDREHALQHIREEGRKVVDHFVSQKRQKLKSYSGETPSYLKKNPAAAFGDIWIDHSADIERVQSVLAHIGREKEFELIRAAAFDVYGIPDESGEHSPAEDPPSAAETEGVVEQSGDKDESSI